MPYPNATILGAADRRDDSRAFSDLLKSLAGSPEEAFPRQSKKNASAMALEKGSPKSIFEIANGPAHC